MRGCGRWFIYSPIKITYITWYLYHSLSHQITSTVVLHLDVMGISTVIYSNSYSLCSKKNVWTWSCKIFWNSVKLLKIPITLNFTWDQKDYFFWNRGSRYYCSELNITACNKKHNKFTYFYKKAVFSCKESRIIL